MSVTCQFWKHEYNQTDDSILFNCKIWTPCKVGELDEDLVSYEPVPGFVVHGYLAPRIETISPRYVLLNNVSKWPVMSKFYMLTDYKPFVFYYPEWDMLTPSPAGVYQKSWKIHCRSQESTT